MRIPLDYYRILGLPIQATLEQLQQAYRDRAVQLPRREYSKLAIAARKQLLDEAYTVLSDPEQRLTYDTTFLGVNLPLSEPDYLETDEDLEKSPTTETAQSVSTDIDTYIPTLEISNNQFVGALLILHELGEYELILKLSQPHLSKNSLNLSLDKGLLGDPDVVKGDLVLTVALACLELGREQWQQGQYENAAHTLRSGQELLLREGLFATVRSEIQSDLYKLRPYRILELLALPEIDLPERRMGLQILQDMLQDRRGIDGTGDDQSGLSIDEFLRFIQQLRSYLTSSEQQALFEAEARRPSAVATYLAVYALLARGFGHRQPSLIRQAKLMLTRLSKRQDVYLEQAICALLLGQTEAASRALELSQESETLNFIREHSQGSPDLLPGLCLYGERWLQTEVFPHFRDLINQKASLKEYFADQEVQTYLESIPAESELATNQWASFNPQSREQTRESNSLNGGANSISNSFPEEPDTYLNQDHQYEMLPADYEQAEAENHLVMTTTSNGRGGSTTIIERSPSNISNLPTAERTSQTSAPGESNHQTSEHSPNRHRSSNNSGENTSIVAVQSHSGEQTGDPHSPPRPPANRTRRTSSKPKFSTKYLPRLILLGVVGLLGLTALGFLSVATYGWLQKTLKGFSSTGVPKEYPLVQLDQPPIPIPKPDTGLSVQGVLTQDTAKAVIQTWLATKAQALGSNHVVDKLDQVLTEPALSTWKQRVKAAKANNGYWEYKHTVNVKSVQNSEKQPAQAKVEAVVREDAAFYEGGQLSQSSSYKDNLRVRYDLIQKNGQWRIRDMTVLN